MGIIIKLYAYSCLYYDPYFEEVHFFFLEEEEELLHFVFPKIGKHQVKRFV